MRSQKRSKRQQRLRRRSWCFRNRQRVRRQISNPILRSAHSELEVAVARSCRLDLGAAAFQGCRWTPRTPMSEKTLEAATAELEQAILRAQKIIPTLQNRTRATSVQQSTTRETHQSSGAAQCEISSTRIRRVLAEADESVPHGLFFEVEEGTCPNADWTITLSNAARSRTREKSAARDLRRNEGKHIQTRCRTATSRGTARCTLHRACEMTLGPS